MPRHLANLVIVPLVLLGCDGPLLPEEDSGATRGRAIAAACCVWIDLDQTLNTPGAWGYPLNPVPAHELCRLLGDAGPTLSAAALTARTGCPLPAFLLDPGLQPKEKECAGVLGPTLSVACASGASAAANKQRLMQELTEQGACAAHLLIDDNAAAAPPSQVALEAPYLHVRPKAFAWSETRERIRQGLDACVGSATGASSPEVNE